MNARWCASWEEVHWDVANVAVTMKGIPVALVPVATAVPTMHKDILRIREHILAIAIQILILLTHYVILTQCVVKKICLVLILLGVVQRIRSFVVICN